MAIKHSITLSTTEPNNEVGVIKIRQADEQTQMLEVQITENGVPKSYTGLTVYFCAKLGQTTGLGIIEQKLNPEEMTNPANGKLEYTMRSEDWQILGRQKGYFSFRKMKDEHEFVEQFTTRDFTFDVIKSVYSDGLKEVKKDGSTYVWTIEEMIRLFKEYISTGKIDWENYKNDERIIWETYRLAEKINWDDYKLREKNEWKNYKDDEKATWEKFVEDNREFLENADPGGKIILELLGGRGEFDSLGERLDEVTTQLTDKEIDIKNIGQTLKTKQTTNKPVIVFITDDGYTHDYTHFRPLFNGKGVPFCTSVVTSTVGVLENKCTKAQLLELQADGHEIMSHTHEHNRLDLMTDAQSEYQFSESKKWLVDNGFTGENIAIPYGFWGDREKEYARKYYRSSRVSDVGIDGFNKSPLETYELKTIWMDSSVVLPGNPSGYAVNTFDYYKYYIDNCKANNGLLIISFHSWDIVGANLLTLFEQVLDYAMTKAEVMTVSEALDVKGNIVDTGNYQRLNKDKKHFVVGHDGKTSSSNFEHVYYQLNAYDGNSAVTAFEDYRITVNKVNTTQAVASNLPEQIGGTLFTYRISDNSKDGYYNYQMYYPILNNGIYMRLCNADKTWGNWAQVNNLVTLGTQTNYALTSGISSYPKGITITSIDSASATTAPNQLAGTLTTRRVSATSTASYNYQTFSEHQTRKEYKRYATSGTTWSAWEETSTRDTYLNSNAVDGNTAISGLLFGVTYNTVNTAAASATGLPEAIAGTLITYKMHLTEHAYSWQEYHVYGSANKYKRGFNSSGTATAWAKLTN